MAFNLWEQSAMPPATSLDRSIGLDLQSIIPSQSPWLFTLLSPSKFYPTHWIPSHWQLPSTLSSRLLLCSCWSTCEDWWLLVWLPATWSSWTCPWWSSPWRHTSSESSQADWGWRGIFLWTWRRFRLPWVVGEYFYGWFWLLGRRWRQTGRDLIGVRSMLGSRCWGTGSGRWNRWWGSYLLVFFGLVS